MTDANQVASQARRFRLTIIVPAYNEEATLAELLGRLRSALDAVSFEGISFSYEVNLVDDGSTDQTPLIGKQVAEDWPELNYFLGDHNGKGSAVRIGLRNATGDAMVIQDADLEYNPDELIHVIAPLARGEADAVFGCRFMEAVPAGTGLWPRIHRFGNRTLTVCSNLMTRLGVNDMETCYKGVRMDILRAREPRSNGFRLEPEIAQILACANARVVQVPISYNPRTVAEGKKIGVKNIFSAFTGIVLFWITVRFRRS